MLSAVTGLTIYLLVEVAAVLASPGGGSNADLIAAASLLIGVPVVGTVYLVARMALRRDLGLTYRLAWITLPVLALAIWLVILAGA